MNRPDLIEELFYELGGKILAHTPLLAGQDAKGKPFPIGSSILLKWFDSYFLCTAGHIIKRFPDGGLYIFRQTYLIPLEGEASTNDRPETDDNVDVATVKLTTECIDAIKSVGLVFFDLRGFPVDHVDSFKKDYIIAGYPRTKIKSKYSNKKKFISEPFELRTEMKRDDLTIEKLKLSSKYNRLFNYPRNRLVDSKTDQRLMGPDPDGLSGCGIWKLPRYLWLNNLDNNHYYPSCLLIEYDHKTNYIIGTRLEIITEGIRRHYEPNIPRSLITITY
jgi:hypothetical protein